MLDLLLILQRVCIVFVYFMHYFTVLTPCWGMHKLLYVCSMTLSFLYCANSAIDVFSNNILNLFKRHEIVITASILLVLYFAVLATPYL